MQLPRKLQEVVWRVNIFLVQIGYLAIAPSYEFIVSNSNFSLPSSIAYFESIRRYCTFISVFFFVFFFVYLLFRSSWFQIWRKLFRKNLPIVLMLKNMQSIQTRMNPRYFNFIQIHSSFERFTDNTTFFILVNTAKWRMASNKAKSVRII